MIATVRLLLSAIIAIWLCGCGTPGPAAYNHRHDLRWDVWLEAHKGFREPVYYVGTIGKDSFFTAGKFPPRRYRAKTTEFQLPRLFPFRKGTPYHITEEMLRPAR